MAFLLQASSCLTAACLLPAGCEPHILSLHPVRYASSKPSAGQ